MIYIIHIQQPSFVLEQIDVMCELRKRIQQQEGVRRAEGA
jgi:hypothetical protein